MCESQYRSVWIFAHPGCFFLLCSHEYTLVPSTFKGSAVQNSIHASVFELAPPLCDIGSDLFQLMERVGLRLGASMIAATPHLRSWASGCLSGLQACHIDLTAPFFFSGFMSSDHTLDRPLRANFLPSMWLAQVQFNYNCLQVI